MKNKISTYFILVLTSLLFVQISFSQINPGSSTDKNMALGNPSNAKPDTTMSDNYLIVKQQYTLSYNNLKHIPNWVSWHVDSTNIGKEDRQNDFRADTTLPVSWYPVSPADYKNTGFDKGHQCPSGDRTSSIPDNSATFLMTNMIPQAPKNNEVTWKNLEDYSRSLVAQGNELYIICGVYGQVGTGKKGAASSIGHGVVVACKYRGNNYYPGHCSANAQHAGLFQTTLEQLPGIGEFLGKTDQIRFSYQCTGKNSKDY